MSVDQERIHFVFQRVSRQLGKISSKPVPAAIHQFRTATRRTEALLEFVGEQDRNQRKLLKQLSRLRRRVGRMRNLDVQIIALRDLKAPQEARFKAQVLHSLSEMRAKRETKLLKALDKETVREIRKRLKRAAASVQVPNKDPYTLASGMFADLNKMPGPLREEVLHQYRIKGKHIRYVAELAGDRPEAKQMVEQLKRMQDALGEWHDWLTLTQTVQQYVGWERHSPLLAQLNSITRTKFQDAIEVVQEIKLQTGTKPVLLGEPAASRRRPAGSQRQAVAAIA